MSECLIKHQIQVFLHHYVTCKKKFSNNIELFLHSYYLLLFENKNANIFHYICVHKCT